MIDEQITPISRDMGKHLAPGHAERIAQSAALRRAQAGDKSDGNGVSTSQEPPAIVVNVSELANNLDGKAGEMFSRLTDETRTTILAAIKDGHITVQDAANALAFHQKAAEHVRHNAKGAGQSKPAGDGITDYQNLLTSQGVEAASTYLEQSLGARAKAGIAAIHERQQQGIQSYSLEEALAASKLKGTEIGIALEQERALD